MDFVLKQVLVSLNDPLKKDDTIQELLSNVKILEDENGETLEIIPIKDFVFQPCTIQPNPEMLKIDVQFRDCAQLSIRDDDVVVVSCPKTGTHWISNMVHYLQKTGPIEEQVSYQPPLIDLFPSQILDSLPSPRILASHQTPDYLPADVYKGRCKVILLFRNPKDVAVSHFYHLKNLALLGEMKLSWNCFVENWINGKVPFIRFFDFYNAWQNELVEKKRLNVLVVNYEEMKRDGFNGLRRISDYLGLQHTDERLQQILNKCAIHNLRNDVNTGKVISSLVDKDGKSMLYRKGIIGDWKNHFTVAQNEMIDAVIKEKFKDSIFKCQY